MAHEHHGHKGHMHSGGLGHVHAGPGKLKLAFFLNLAIVLVELIGGFRANSLALLSDAGHNATDVFAIGLAWFAAVQVTRAPTGRMTYGYHRSGILVALANSLSLLGITLVIAWEAVTRLLRPEAVAPVPLLVTAGVGLVLNTWAAVGLRGDEDVNTRSAFLHLFGDAAASLGIIIGGLVLMRTGWTWVDPVLGVLIAALIAVGAWGVVRRTIAILMESTPERIDTAAVVSALLRDDEVLSVHDVHIWSIAVGRNALSCHVVVRGDQTVGQMRPLLERLSKRLAEEFGVGHSTIQLECLHHGHDRDCGAPDTPAVLAGIPSRQSGGEEA